MRDLRRILDEIAPHNNVYRDRQASVRDKLAALWEIGDVLVKAGVASAHSFGWRVQRETGGLVKRPTIFRSHKFRVVWPDKNQFLRTFGRIQGLSSLVEMLPLLDPAQRGKHRVPAKVVNELVSEMQRLAPSQFKARLDAVKKTYADTTLGKTYNRNRDLGEVCSLARSLNNVYARMQSAVMREHSASLRAMRRDIPADELQLFSSMCLALTTKENRALCRTLPHRSSQAKDAKFRLAFDGAAALLRGAQDARRAKLRKLVTPEALADLADLCNSVTSEKGVRAYKGRARVSIAL